MIIPKGNPEGKNFGEHLRIDAYQADFNRLNDKDHVRNSIELLPEILSRFAAYAKNSSFMQFLIAYHRNHLLRMISDDEGRLYDANGSFSIQHFTGAYTDKLLG